MKNHVLITKHIRLFGTSSRLPMKMEITGNAMPSPIVAIIPMTIRYHSGALALTTRHNEGSGRALSCLSNYT